jgi:hypothetical protein
MASVQTAMATFHAPAEIMRLDGMVCQQQSRLLGFKGKLE